MPFCPAQSHPPRCVYLSAGLSAGLGCCCWLSFRLRLKQVGEQAGRQPGTGVYLLRRLGFGPSDYQSMGRYIGRVTSCYLLQFFFLFTVFFSHNDTNAETFTPIFFTTHLQSLLTACLGSKMAGAPCSCGRMASF